MRVKEIVIDGFKSYAKRTVISPWDPQFNCITGLNGSGKSNILDAICFVLGITSMSTVRAQNQQDLIYKRGQAGVTKASVSIVFDNTDKSRSPLDYVDEDVITVTRQVVLGGTSKYLVNGHRAQQIQVQQLFQEVQLNINNPNFLIMQGQITKVVNMRPTEILGLIEEAAGTGMYEKERIRAVKEIKERDAPLLETEALLNEEVRPKLEVWRRQKRDYLAYQQCSNSIEALERVVVGSQYNLQKVKLDQLQSEKENLSSRNEELKADISSLEERLQELEDKIKDAKFEDSRSETTVRLEQEIQSLNEEHARMLITLEDKQQQLSRAEEQYSKSKNAVSNLEQQLSAHNEKVGAFEEEHAHFKESLAKQHDLVTEKRDLLSSLQTGISTSGDKETGYASITKKLREQILDAKNSISKLESRKKELSSNIESNRDHLSSLQTQYNEQNERLRALDNNNKETEEALVRLSDNAKEAKNLKNSLSSRRDDAAGVLRNIDRLLANYPSLSIPSDMQIDRVKGRLIHVFRLLDEHKNKAKALEICAGSNLWSMVVEDTATAETILRRAKRKRLYVLPLSKLQPRVIDPRRVAQIHPDGAWRAIDLLGFDEDVRPAIEFAFGSTVICATSDIAKKAAFEFRFRAITLEGDSFEPRGVITGGSDDSRRGANIFSVVDDYHRLVGQKLEYESEAQRLEEQISQFGNVASEVEQMSNELGLSKHTADMTRTRVDQLNTKIEELRKTEEEYHRISSVEIPALNNRLQELEADLQKSLNDASEFNNNREGKIQKLRKEVENAEAEERRVTKLLETRDEQHVVNQSELVRIRTEIDQESEEMRTAENLCTDTRGEIDQLSNNHIPELSSRISNLRKTYDTEIAKVSEIRQELSAYENEINQGKARLSDLKVDVKKGFHELSRSHEKVDGATNALKLIEKRYPRASELAAELEAQGKVSHGSNLNVLAGKLSHEQKRMKELASRVDASVISMVERLENDETQLRQRLVTISNDKAKLSQSMETLNERRCVTIDNVWKQVSNDFGAIFGDLLPGSSCELVPVNNNPIKDGFSIKVCLGQTWKDGLTELSGGQRSLVALSLILALLRYQPAPMYILDEVDAALDVHHTRNIGHIIKTRFKNAQFIVVSLKDDMFTNANRIFQTRFIDGTSTVHIMA